MCGILGEFVNGTPLLSKSDFLTLNRLSYKRGPDSAGFFSNEKNVQLGFNRLAILDLSENGNQPMHSPSGRFTIVFNGEIYNHIEIRNKVYDHSPSFKGTSDTETIVAALDVLGLRQTVELLDGMFAIGVYDHEEDLLHLVRDFAGIKPLHYGMNNNTLVFASQYDQITSHPNFCNNSIDASVLKLYLKQHYVPAPFGILEKTFQVRPGEIVTIKKDFTVIKERFWEFPDSFEPQIFHEKEALEFLNEVLDNAVRDELLSDVPLGAFLSGGIDSPLVCYYAQNHISSPLKAFTIGSDSQIHDESDDAGIYAKAIMTNFHLEKMDSSKAHNELALAISSLKEPFADPSIIPTYLVSKMAKKEVTVALSGDGGDELFFGYERFWSIIKNAKFKSLPDSFKYALYGADKVLFKNRHINSNILFDSFGKAHFALHSRFPDTLLDNIFPDLKNTMIPEEFEVYQYDDPKTVLELLCQMRKAEFYGMMQKTLHKVDRASMENSLEVRVPFLKKSFIEASFKIDPYLSFGKNKKKEILKKLLKSNIPDAPIDNRKRGFSVPLDKWIREELKQPFEDTILGTKENQQTFGVDIKEIEKTFHQHLNKENDLKWPIFTIYSLFNWKGCLKK